MKRHNPRTIANLKESVCVFSTCLTQLAPTSREHLPMTSSLVPRLQLTFTSILWELPRAHGKWGLSLSHHPLGHSTCFSFILSQNVKRDSYVPKLEGISGQTCSKPLVSKMRKLMSRETKDLIIFYLLVRESSLSQDLLLFLLPLQHANKALGCSPKSYLNFHQKIKYSQEDIIRWNLVKVP